MGTRLRLVEPHVIYNVTATVVDRQFAFRPNHGEHHRLLAEDCPLESLDPKSDLIPTPSIVNIIGASVGRALVQHPVQLHWFESNINHAHIGYSCTKEQRENASPFFRDAMSGIARGVNRTWEREGHLFGARYRQEACVDDTAAEAKLVYALTNPVKDGQVETVSDSPFFSTYRHLARGEPLRFFYIDYEGWWDAGGPRCRKYRLKDFLRWVEWSTTPLPAWQDLTEPQRQTRTRKLVQAVEEEETRKRREENRTIIGVAALRALDPRDRPKNPKPRTRQPLCHAADDSLRREYRRKWRAFVDEHQRASNDYRNGMHDRDFPDGSYAPPLIKLRTGSS